MLRWNQYTVRGAIASGIGCLGIIYEWFISKRKDLLVILLYGLILGIGVWLLAFFNPKKLEKE